MKHLPMHNRKCSPLAVAGMGAVVCLGGAQAAILDGNIASSNATTVFNIGDPLLAFSSKVKWSLSSTLFTGGIMSFSTQTGTGSLNEDPFNNGYASFHNASVTVSPVMPGGFAYGLFIKASQSDKYLAVRFEDSGNTRFGWLHVVSTNDDQDVIRLDTWGYEDSGAGIKTLTETIKPVTLPLEDGRSRIYWTNKNEAGISRYEVQVQNPSGAWVPVESAAPGAGRYAIDISRGQQARLRVEKVDGQEAVIAL